MKGPVFYKIHMENSAASVPRWVYKQASVTFHSVAAFFLVEEWERLEGWQQELYTNVMKDIHRALLALGHKIANPDILFQIKQQEESRFRRPLDSDAGEMTAGSGARSVGVGLDSALKVKQEIEPCPLETPNKASKEKSSCPTSSELVYCPDMSLWIKQVEEPMLAVPGESVDAKGSGVLMSPCDSLQLKKEKDLVYIAVPCNGPSDGVNSPPAGNLPEKLKLDICQNTVQSDLPRNSESLSEKSALEQGFRRVDQVNRFQCNTCMKCFIHFSSFKAHHRTHTGEKPFKCSMCRKSFSHSSNLSQHVRIHTGERPHTCAECGKAFTTKSHLITHQRLHSGERPHVCGDCGKTFTMKSHLVTHQRLHTGERPYKCNKCIQSYRKASDLVRHARIHTGEKPYHCSLCEKRFNNLQCLKIHQRSHTGEKPYQCSQCEKGFLQNSDLIRHQKTHTGERPFQCNQCEKNFPQRSDLIRHEKTHSAERSYRCPECDKGFNLKSGLTRHQKLHIGMRRMYSDISTPSCIDFFHCKLDSPKSASPI